MSLPPSLSLTCPSMLTSISTSLEKEHKVVNLVKKKDVGGGVAVKIERAPWEPARLYGRQ